MNEITNKEKLITIFKKALPKCLIEEVHVKKVLDNYLALTMRHKLEFSIDVYKRNECFGGSEVWEDDNSGEYYIQYNNLTESYMFESKQKGRSGLSNLQFVCREVLTEQEYNDIVDFTKSVVGSIGKSFGEANIDSVYESLK